MNHRLAQVFRISLSPHLLEGDFVSRPVVFQHQWMIDRKIRRPLLKVASGISARGHQIAQQLIRFGDRTGGSVNEARLDSAPRFFETGAFAGGEGPNLKATHSLCPPFEPGFGVTPISALLDSSGVFSVTEPSAQFCGTAFA